MQTDPGHLLQLIPCGNAHSVAFDSLYLRHDIRRFGSVNGPFIYSNFILSLDGRISVPDRITRIQKVPEANANFNDITLFKQLLAQSDAVITTGRHLRAVARNQENTILSLDPISDSKLIQWRLSRGLKAQPDFIVFSKSLRLPDPRALPFAQSSISVMTWSKISEPLRRELMAKGYRLLAGTETEFSRGDLMAYLREFRYSAVYSVAGPAIFSELIRCDLLDRLYLTITQIMLGGDQVNTITSGVLFEKPRRFSLQELYFDPRSPQNAGQFFCVFDCVRP